MSKGIVYLMTTAVNGVIKIGKTKTDQYPERMRNLERNGYYNISGFKQYFAIELEDYSEKELLLDEIFEKHQIADSELFALDKELVKQLLLSFEGKVIYPPKINKEKDFKETVERRANISFEKLGIPEGAELFFIKDKNKKCIVQKDNKITYEGKKTSLSKLARELINSPYPVQGTVYWEYKGETLWNRRLRLEENID